MARVRSGELPWMKVDALHRMKLDEMLGRLDISRIPEDAIDHLNRVWHRLLPWPDTPGGLNRLRSLFVVASLSNGNVSLLTNMAKNGGFAWDCVLSAELSGAFKPDPNAYTVAADQLGLEPGNVMMVAAHKGDLEAARDAGLRTALVYRPDEYGPDGDPDVTPESPSGNPYDYVATDFHHLADQLGCARIG